MNNKKYKLAVYGTLKKGYSNHRLLKDAKLLGVTNTNPVFKMYSLGSFPCVTKHGNTSLHVEIYEVEEPTLKRVYQLEGYTGERDHDRNWYDTLDLKTEWGNAEMFYFKQEPSHYVSMVENGNW